MSPPVLPAPRTPGRYSVALVCLGNICRSPIADVVLSARLVEAGLDDRVEVASCGTGDWHTGEPMDSRAAATLERAGLDPTTHRARLFDPTWLERHDLVLAMDEQNLADVGGRDRTTGRVGLLRDLDPVDPGSEVPDPYYGGPDGFEEVLAMVERSCAVLVASLADLLAQRPDA